MNKWIAEFDLEDGDTMPEHMDLEYKGAKIDFHCRPKEPILDKINKMKSEIADSLEFWDYSPNNNPLARDILETLTNFLGDMREVEE